jgi:hypothetical protein
MVRKNAYTPKRAGVRDQRLDPHRSRRCLDDRELTVEGVEKQLQRRQALLSVDDRPLLHQSRLHRRLLEHHGAEEVWVVLGVRIAQ